MHQNKRILFIIFIGLVSLTVLMILDTGDNFSVTSENYFNDVEDYRKFIQQTKEYQKNVSEEEFWKQHNLALNYIENNPDGENSSNLTKTIIDELNIEFLLKGINERNLTVVDVSRKEYDEYIEKELIFEDPYIGNLSALMVIPKQKGIYPAIIGLHGHGGDQDVAKEEFFAHKLAQEGFVVIMPSFRAMNCEESEFIITKKLNGKGFTLMGIRVYEANLLFKYLDSLDYVENIGIISHSGGSVVGILFSYINDDLGAIVYDCETDFLELCGEEPHCETIPGLAYYRPQIFEPKNIKIPSKLFEYDQIKEKETIDFFKKELNKEK